MTIGTSKPTSRRPGDWFDSALCRGAEVRLFYPLTKEPADTAKAICGACPVQSACLEHALAVGERWGVWGGLTEGERRVLRRRPAVS